MRKPTKKDIEKWVKALRSGEYNQTRGKLEDYLGYCCLGVACKEFIPESKLYLSNNNYLRGGHPRGQNHAPEWLVEINNLVSLEVGTALGTMNDVYEFTFNQIAEILEDLFIKEIGSDLVKQKIEKLKEAWSNEQEKFKIIS